MQDFAKRLNNGSGILNFYFNRVHTKDDDRYHVNVVGKDRKVYSFNLKKEKDGWVLEDPETCPIWALRMEKSFTNAILEHLSV